MIASTFRDALLGGGRRVLDWYFSLDDDDRFWRHLVVTLLVLGVPFAVGVVWVLHRFAVAAGVA